MTSPLDQIPRLAALLAETGIDTLDLSGPDGCVRLARTGAPAPRHPSAASAAAAVGAEPEDRDAPTLAVASPGIGTFRRAHPLNGEAFAEEGASVAAGQVLALLQIGALLQPVRAPADGILVSVRKAEGALTGFGDPLFDLLPT